MKVQAVSLWQPWASLIAHGHKTIETRSWPCPWPPGTVFAVHAAKKWNHEIKVLCLTEPFRETLGCVGVPPPSVKSWTLPMVEASRRGWDLPFGAVVCLARLRECLPAKEAIRRPGLVSTREMHFGDYSGPRWCWVFEGARRLEPPVPARGMQGVWPWEAPADVDEVVASLGRAAT